MFRTCLAVYSKVHRRRVLMVTASTASTAYLIGLAAINDESNPSSRFPPFLSSSISLCSTEKLRDQNHEAQQASTTIQRSNHHILSKRTTGPVVISKNTSIVDSVIPTLQAAIRATRLVGTTFIMVMDYELAKWMPLSTYVFATNEQVETDEERKYWETEIEKREAELDHAQLVYTGRRKASQHSEQQDPNSSKGDTESHQEDENQVLDEERRQIKVQQKQAMHEAAQRLAHAEDELNRLGGESLKSRLHRRAAQRLLNLCRTNGGVYIKVGQHLANLDYLIPSEYIDVLSTLFNDAPQSTIQDVHKVIEEDLGSPVVELFDNFDPKPIASASLAQVHVAYDKATGRKLAVKVQHRGLRETSMGDILAVTTVVRLVDWLFDDFTFAWIAEEIAPNLPKELEFSREGRNAELAAYNLQQHAGSSSSSFLDCVIPEVVWPKTSSRVLTMEFEEGFKTTDTEAMEASGLNKSDVAKLVSSVFFSQVFLSSFVHCDPHPANVLLRKNKHGKPQMVLVDHGLYKRIDDDFRIQYAQLWRSLMLADLDGIQQSCNKMGIDKAYTLFAALLTARPFDEIMERSKTGSLGVPKTTMTRGAQSGAKNGNSSPPHVLDSREDKAMIRGYAKHFLKDIIALLGTVPRQMLLLLKMNDCIRHINYALGSPTNTLIVAGQYASRGVYEHQLQQQNMHWKIKFQAWLDYSWVMLRIQVYDISAWFMETMSSIATATTWNGQGKMLLQ